MAVFLCGEDDRELFRLTIRRDSKPCELTFQRSADGNVEAHFVANTPGKIDMIVSNIGISPACSFTILREDNSGHQRVNDYRFVKLADEMIVRSEL